MKIEILPEIKGGNIEYQNKRKLKATKYFYHILKWLLKNWATLPIKWRNYSRGSTQCVLSRIVWKTITNSVPFQFVSENCVQFYSFFLALKYWCTFVSCSWGGNEVFLQLKDWNLKWILDRISCHCSHSQRLNFSRISLYKAVFFRQIIVKISQVSTI